MDYNHDGYPYSKGYLIHYGVPKQKHGVRRYQYLDGSLTPLGRIHYGVGKARATFKEIQKKKRKRHKDEIADAVARGESQSVIDTLVDKYGNRAVTKKAVLSSNDPDFVYKHRKKLSDEELEKVIARINKENELKKSIDNEKISQQERDKVLNGEKDKTPAEDTAEKNRIAKDKVLKSDDPKEILKYKDQLTATEMQEVLNRLDKIRQLQALSAPAAKKKRGEFVAIGAKKIASAAWESLIDQMAAAVKGGVSYGTQHLAEKLFEDKDELKGYIVGSMKGSKKKDNKSNNN